MRDRRAVFDRLDGQAGGLQGRDRTFASGTRTLDSDFHFLDAELDRLFGRLLASHLAGERRALAASLEAAGASAGPTRVSPLVSVIVTVVLLNVAWMKAMPTVTLRRIFLFFVFATATQLLYKFAQFRSRQPKPALSRRRTPPCNVNYRRSFTPFLPATVFFGPFRVRALVRVRWPRTGSPKRCRIPR